MGCVNAEHKCGTSVSEVRSESLDWMRRLAEDWFVALMCFQRERFVFLGFFDNIKRPFPVIYDLQAKEISINYTFPWNYKILFIFTFPGLEIPLLKLHYLIYPGFSRQWEPWFFKEKLLFVESCFQQTVHVCLILSYRGPRVEKHWSIGFLSWLYVFWCCCCCCCFL